jgi:uncharacterized protein
MLKKVLIKQIFFLCFLLIPWLAAAVTPPVPATPPGQIVDLANIIDNSLQQQLVRSLRELTDKTGTQMVILTISSLDGQDINSFSLQTAEQWKLGQKDKDNGLLLSVSLQDKKYRFETGYGLESVLPDSLLGSIARNNLVPWFKKGEYGTGIASASREIITILGEQHQVAIESSGELPQPVKAEDSSGGIPMIFVLMVIAFIIFAKSRSMNKRSRGPGMVIFPGGWGSGGGFGGGGGGFGGGFSGGGGGFGGGGASGGW